MIHRPARLLVVLMTVAALASAEPKPKAAAKPVSLVILSIDGLRPDYVLDADRYGLKIPNLRLLVHDGAHAAAVTGVLPTVTYPSHTTIVTGAAPARHGITSNMPFDPTGKNMEGWNWYAEDIKVPTLWDVAAKAGLTTGNVEWPVALGAHITWNLPQYWRANTPEDTKLHKLLVTPGLLAELEPTLGPYPGTYDWSPERDAGRARYAIGILEHKRPRLMLVYFGGLDHTEHETLPGSPETLAVLEQIDGLVGQVRAAAERLGPTVFAVVSDHGFHATDHEVSINEALRAEGLINLDGRGRVTDWRAMAWSVTGSAAIVLRSPDDAAARAAVERALKRLDPKSVGRLLTGADADALGGFPGATWVVSMAPGYRVGSSLEEPVTRVAAPRGVHGMSPDDHEMDASFFVVGPGVAAGRDLGRVDMRDVGPTLAARIGLTLPAAEGRDVLK